MTYSVPVDYRVGVPAGNAIASGGFSESFVIKRFVPNNGTDFRLGSRVNFKIADAECILHPNQMYLKWKPLAQSGGAKYEGTEAQGAISGQTAAIKNVSLTCMGKQIENIQNYNRFCAQEYINSPLELKIYLEKTEGLTFFSNGKMTRDNRRSFLGDNNGNRYAMHQLQVGLRGMSSLELPLIPSGIDLELVLTTAITEAFPVSHTIDNILWQNVELVAVFTRPPENFWSNMAHRLQRGEVLQRPIQTIRYQSYQPTNSSSFTMTIDSGVVRSVSSILVCGNDTKKTHTDKLNYSTDLGIRSISFSVGGKRIPEGKAISYSINDPELYVLGFRGRDYESMCFVPSTYLFDEERLTSDVPGATAGEGGAKVVRGWQFRFNLKDALSGYGDGLSTLTGSFQINVSTIPESPDFLSETPPALGAESSLDVWYVTDQVAEISASGFKLTPVW